jgi:hypothetical protein
MSIRTHGPEPCASANSATRPGEARRVATRRRRQRAPGALPTAARPTRPGPADDVRRVAGEGPTATLASGGPRGARSPWRVPPGPAGPGGGTAPPGPPSRDADRWTHGRAAGVRAAPRRGRRGLLRARVPLRRPADRARQGGPALRRGPPARHRRRRGRPQRLPRHGQPEGPRTPRRLRRVAAPRARRGGRHAPPPSAAGSSRSRQGPHRGRRGRPLGRYRLAGRVEAVDATARARRPPAGSAGPAPGRPRAAAPPRPTTRPDRPHPGRRRRPDAPSSQLVVRRRPDRRHPRRRPGSALTAGRLAAATSSSTTRPSPASTPPSSAAATPGGWSTSAPPTAPGQRRRAAEHPVGPGDRVELGDAVVELVGADVPIELLTLLKFGCCSALPVRGPGPSAPSPSTVRPASASARPAAPPGRRRPARGATALAQASRRSSSSTRPRAPRRSSTCSAATAGARPRAERDVLLDDVYVSDEHAEILPDDGGWSVRDLGSTNGTFLNGAKVTRPTPLAAGDQLRLGKTRIEVRR